MKINRIYIKIFLAFIVLLIVSEVLIFGLFRYLSFFPAHGRYGEMFEAVASVSRNYAGDQLSGPGRINFLTYLEQLSERTGVVIWLKQGDEITFKTFKEEMPRLEAPFHEMKKPSYTFRRQRRGMVLQVEIPMKEKRGESLVLFYDGRHAPHHDARFLQGLLAIGCILALLLFPFSRYISKPLRKLRDSAQRISRGHLDERVSVSGGDEIGQLGEAFNDMAENLEKMVTETREITAHISHELRSPLARLRVAGELLEEKIRGGGGHAAERLFGTINSEIEEMDHLIGQILLLSKVEQRDASIEKVPHDLREVVNSTMERYGNLFKKRNISLKMHFASEPVPVDMVKEDISMAVSCIMDNAARYADEHTSVEVTIKLSEGGVLFSVENRGGSCTEEELEQIFEPFRRFNESEGAGLGLSLVRKVVGNHNGTVRAECVEGFFSIHVKLPMKGS